MSGYPSVKTRSSDKVKKACHLFTHHWPQPIRLRYPEPIYTRTSVIEHLLLELEHLRKKNKLDRELQRFARLGEVYKRALVAN